MNTLDRVFLVVFARCLRKKGRSNWESAWFCASYRVSSYITWPVAAGALVSVALAYALFGSGSPAEHKHAGQLVAVIAWITVSFLLDRRFRRFRDHPPTLTQEESTSDHQLVFRFRLLSFGVFALTCLVGFFLRRAQLLQGF